MAANGHGITQVTGASLSTDSPPYVKPSTRLRQLLAEPGCLQAPGVYDGMSARLAIEAGFKCMVRSLYSVWQPFVDAIQYMSGAMTTASKLGLPDLAFASLNDFAANGEMIANLDLSVPLIADADTGFGGPNAIARTVATYNRVGIAGFHLEDQIQMKRCGHLKGKQLCSME
jgi:2-methylisocitrate lyase-like PEP mutase family enzyme